MLVSLSDMKSYLGIVDTQVQVDVVADAVGTIYDKTVVGDGSLSLESLMGAGYTFTNGSTVILGYEETFSTTGGGPAIESSFSGTVANATEDKFLLEQLNLYSSTVDNYCGRKLEATNWIQDYYRTDFYEDSKLWLYQYPINSVASVKEIETAYGVDTESTLETYQYRTNDKVGTILRLDEGAVLSWFSCAGVNSRIQITYNAGYAYEDIPLEIQSAIKSLVAERYNKEKGGIELGFGSDVQRVSIPGVMSVDFDYTLQANERDVRFGMLLGNYVNIFDPYRSERVITGEIKENYVS